MTKSQSNSQLNGYSFLVVDDSSDILTVIQAVLERDGATVSCFENAPDAIENLRVQTYDALIMDIEMPEMDGCRALGIIREELKLKTPALAATAYNSTRELQKIEEAGFDAIISKANIVRDLPFELLRLVTPLDPDQKGVTRNSI